MLGLRIPGYTAPRPLHFKGVVLNSEQQQTDIYCQKEQNYMNTDLTVGNSTVLIEVFARLSF